MQKNFFQLPLGFKFLPKKSKMALEKLLAHTIQTFINDHVKSSIDAIAFKKNPFPEVDYKLILNQIEAKAKAEKKLPTWFAAQNILYPSKIAIEQTSSEITAAYKCQWVDGASLVDLTGGFGVDSYYFSEKLSHVFHCEQNSELSAIVQHNYHQLNKNNITCISGDGLEWLQKNNRQIDWLYIDPSRRNEHKGKVFLLADCEPNVPNLLPIYWKYTQQILIKTAPILDITAALRELEFVKDVLIVAVANEVKEVLFSLKYAYAGPVTVHAITISTSNASDYFSFTFGSNVVIAYSFPQNYLYEPNAAVLKSGGHDQLAVEKQLQKLHPHTHLYTSNEWIDYPGRCFTITEQVDYSKVALKRIRGQKFNITTRNFPETVADLRKKGNIKEGGDDYLFFVTLKDQRKVILFTKKINRTST